MPVKMIASRRFYHDADRRDIEAGAEFTVADADAAARLERRKKATRAPEPVRPAKVDIPVLTKAAEPVADAEAAEAPAPLAPSYLRRDMRAEDGRTGETTSFASSRRGRQPRTRTSDESEE